MADGAAAAIICSEKAARRLGCKKPISISACALRSAGVGTEDDEVAVARAAYERAGLGPEDVEVAEVHDAMAPAEMYRIVGLGFCKPEEAGRWVEEERTSLKGDKPVNTSGGLAARGHPIGATGLAQLAEIVWQMRGEAGSRQVMGKSGDGPKVGLTQNSGGFIDNRSAAYTVTVLAK